MEYLFSLETIRITIRNKSKFADIGVYNLKNATEEIIMGVQAISDIKALFSQWKETHQEEPDEVFRSYSPSGSIPKKSFLPDGIIDIGAYERAEPKILFVAKEANWFHPQGDNNTSTLADSPFWLRDVVEDRLSAGRGGSSFSRRLALLAGAALSEPVPYKALGKTAFLNLNKRGGFRSCVWQTLEGYVSQYRSFIRQEIELIAPDYIICCGSGVKWLLDKYECVPYGIRMVVVYHPSYFALSDEEYLQQLDCAMKGMPWQPSSNKRPALTQRSSEQKGIIFDTNKTYSTSAAFEMLTGDKVSVYWKKPGFLDCFQRNDLIFYYIKGWGIVAAGEIISDEQVAEGDDHELYKTVRMLVPAAIPQKEESLAVISPGELKELLGHNFYWAQAAKRPYLSKQECEAILALLREKYSVQ